MAQAPSTQINVDHPVSVLMYPSGLTERGRLRNKRPSERAYIRKVVMTHLAWTESICIRLSHVLERLDSRADPSRSERDGSARGCRGTQLVTPSTALDIAKNITIAAHILILVRRVVDDRVDSTRDKIPAGIAGPRNVAIAGTLPGVDFEVPS
jgi:hypothetical protein